MEHRSRQNDMNAPSMMLVSGRPGGADPGRLGEPVRDTLNDRG
jgi:hypothetical protein